MPPRITHITLAGLAVASLSSTATFAATEDAAPHVPLITIKESIELSRYSSLTWEGSRLGTPGRVSFSPDRRHFFVVVDSSDVDDDVNISQLLLFSTENVEARLRTAADRVEPLITAKFKTTSSGRSAISMPTWSGNDEILFNGFVPFERVGPIGATESGANLYRLTISAGTIEQVTDLKFQHELAPYVHSYVSLDGGTLVKVISPTLGPKPPETYPMELADSSGLDFASSLRVWFQSPPLMQDIYFYPKNGPATQISRSEFDVTQVYGIPGSAPANTETLVFGSNEAGERLDSWDGYDGPRRENKFGRFRAFSTRLGRLDPALDLAYGTETQMGARFATGIPRPDRPEINFFTSPRLYYAGPDDVVLVNVALPIDPAHAERRSTAYVVAYSISTHRVQVMGAIHEAKGDIFKVAVTGGRCLTLSRVGLGQAPVSNEYFELNKGRWSPAKACVEAVPPVNPAFEASIVEDNGLPPRLVAREAGREIVLRGPDPMLEHRSYVVPKEVEWVEKDGRVVKGGLFLPRDRDGPFPLVIMAYNYFPKLFLLNGFQEQQPAQALAAAGIASLMMDIPAEDRKETTNSPREAEAMVERVDAAVESLASRGLVDPARVGMFGFSRGGYMSRYVATFPGKIRLAAAIADDSFHPDFFNLNATLASRNTNVDQVLLDNTGVLGEVGPFWTNKEAWLRYSPNLNLEKLRTPFLMGTRSDRNWQFAEATEMAAIRSIGAPIQIARFPLAEHMPMRPRQREAWMTLFYDWMRFWLLNEEDTSETKRAMYLEWRRIRSELNAK